MGIGSTAMVTSLRRANNLAGGSALTLGWPTVCGFLQRVGHACSSPPPCCPSQQDQSPSAPAHRSHKTKNCSTAILSDASPASPSLDSHACNGAFLSSLHRSTH